MLERAWALNFVHIITLRYMIIGQNDKFTQDIDTGVVCAIKYKQGKFVFANNDQLSLI